MPQVLPQRVAEIVNASLKTVDNLRQTAVDMSFWVGEHTANVSFQAGAKALLLRA